MPRGEDANDKGDYKAYWDNVKEVHQVRIQTKSTNVDMVKVLILGHRTENTAR